MLAHNASAESEFEPLELIGYGSFGSIRKVRRRTDNQILVRKEILYRHMNDKERGQLVAELSILSCLKHDNIVRYFHHEHIEQQQIVHLYMDYCPHGDLGKVIREHASCKSYIPEDTIWNIFSQLVSALYRCHIGGDPAPIEGSIKLSFDQEQHPTEGIIVHRDLKPDNIFLGPDWTIKLGDFGLAKVIRDTTIISNSYVGTPIYMSPEVLDGLPCTTKGDIWAFGCVIYELCTLEPPFNSNTLMQLSESIHKSKYRPIPEFYSHGLSQVIAACLQVDPTNRPTVEALIDLPVVKIWRRDRQVAKSIEALNEWESRLIKREQELSVRESQLVEWHEKQAVLEESFKCQIRDELRVKFEAELQARIEEEMKVIKIRQPDEETTSSKGNIIVSAESDNSKIGKVTAAAAAWTKFYSPIVAKHNSQTNRDNKSKVKISDSPMDITMLCSPRGDDLFSASPLVTRTKYGLRSPLRLGQVKSKNRQTQQILGQLDASEINCPLSSSSDESKANKSAGAGINPRKLFRTKSTTITGNDENYNQTYTNKAISDNKDKPTGGRVNRRTQSFAGATFTNNNNNNNLWAKDEFMNFR